MKPILIDALHIKAGGALRLLDYLVEKLLNSNIEFVLLKDELCPAFPSEKLVSMLEVMSSSHRSRKSYYKDHRDFFSSILCFGNLPPVIKMNAKVYTYMHNVSLLAIPSDYGLNRKILSYLKRIYIKYYSRYTDAWIIQTTNSENLLRQYLPCQNKHVYRIPFCRLPNELALSVNKIRNDYVFIGEHTNAKGDNYLVEAWALLAERGFKKKLHLTLAAPEMVEPIKNAIARGANIQNHGHVPFEEVVQLYYQSKATIYPSLNESFGMGIIEAITAGCDVIGSDLPYLYSVCEPSEVFASKSPQAIVDAVLRYEKEKSIKTKLTVRDNINELIELLTT